MAAVYGPEGDNRVCNRTFKAKKGRRHFLYPKITLSLEPPYQTTASPLPIALRTSNGRCLWKQDRSTTIHCSSQMVDEEGSWTVFIWLCLSSVGDSLAWGTPKPRSLPSASSSPCELCLGRGVGFSKEWRQLAVNRC